MFDAIFREEVREEVGNGVTVVEILGLESTGVRVQNEIEELLVGGLYK